MNRNEKIGMLSQLKSELLEQQIKTHNFVSGMLMQFDKMGVSTEFDYLMRLDTRSFRVLSKAILSGREAMDKLAAQIKALEEELSQ